MSDEGKPILLRLTKAPAGTEGPQRIRLLIRPIRGSSSTSEPGFPTSLKLSDGGSVSARKALTDEKVRRRCLRDLRLQIGAAQRELRRLDKIRERLGRLQKWERTLSNAARSE